ncbi:MAG: helix-turn-helix domain-containing protein [Proteobacteria bacterium]|nr:helix-turn-helix domain-containing protein [Pseudomonadota bacterium]
MTRLLYNMAEAAKKLNICKKTLLSHVRAGEIRYILTGKRTRQFADSDLQEFIEQQRKTLCPSTSRKTPRTGTLTSSSRVYDFTARREQRSRPKRA